MMKKYITPAVELTAMRSEGVIATSFTVSSETTIGGAGYTGPGQLTNRQEWEIEDWTE